MGQDTFVVIVNLLCGFNPLSVIQINQVQLVHEVLPRRSGFVSSLKRTIHYIGYKINNNNLQLFIKCELRQD